MRTSPLQVLQIVTSTHRRGAETFAVDLGEALAVRCRSVATVALRRASGGAALPIDVVEGNTPLTRWRNLRRQVGRSDVVVAHGSATLRAVAGATFPRYRPFVYRFIGDPTYWASSRSRHLRVAALLSRAAAVAVYYEGAAVALHDKYGLPEDRVRVIRKGVAVEGFAPVGAEERRAARARLGLGPDDRVAVVVGALSSEKNVGLAVDAVSRLDDVGLIVVGDGPERESLEQGATALGDRVRFVGRTAEPDLYRAAADVNLLTSRTEGVPSSLIESGLLGIPSVATDVGGVREVVVDGASGFVVTPDPAAVASALEVALGSARQLGAEARRICLERFPIGPVADAWVELLTDVTG